MRHTYIFRVFVFLVVFIQSFSLVLAAPLILSGTAGFSTHWYAGGVQVTIPLSVTNTGAVPFLCVKIKSPSAAYTWISGSASGWTAKFAGTGDALLFDGGPLLTGQSKVFNVTIQVPATTQTNRNLIVQAGDAPSGSNNCTGGRNLDASSTGALDINVDATLPAAVTVTSVTATSPYSVTVVSGVSSDANSGLNSAPYFFDETTGAAGGLDSDWQGATTYVNSGLRPLTQYCYRVKARDLVLNETAYSSAVCVTTPTDDNDTDGLTNDDETARGTDPNDSDSDDDGLSDGDEVSRGTNPLDMDSDDDSYSDGSEVANGTDPLDENDPPVLPVDSDGDGLSDDDETARGTNPNDADSDDDSYSDGAEVLAGTNPLDPLDPPPLVVDNDGDGLSDGDEAVHGTNPNDPDSDDDGLNDGNEVTRGTDPLDIDSDDDGYSDGTEIIKGTNPLDFNDPLPPVLTVNAGTDEGFGFGSAVVFKNRAYVLGTEEALITTATIDWGDGTVDSAVLRTEGGIVYLDGSHDYEARETFEVKVCVATAQTALQCDAATISVTGSSGSGSASGQEMVEEVTEEEEVSEEEVSEEEAVPEEVTEVEEEETVSEEAVSEEEPEDMVIPVEDETDFIQEEVEEEEVGTPGTTTPVNIPGETVTQVPIAPTPKDLTPPVLNISDLASGVLADDQIGFTGILTDRGGVVEKLKISLDGGASTFPVNTVSGLGTNKATFKFNAAGLTDGNYRVIVYSEDNSGNLLTSEVYEMVVDRYDPYIGSSYLSSGVLGLLPNGQGVHQSAVGLVQDFYIPVGGGATEVRLVEVDRGMSIDLVYIESIDLWKGSMSFDSAGWWNFEVHAKDGAGNEKNKAVESIYVREEGALVSADGEEVEAYEVSIYSYNPQEKDWQFWDSQPYNQINPYRAGTTAGFAFTLPAGQYYFTASAEGYRPLTSEILELTQSTVVTPNFTLERAAGVSEWPVIGWFYKLFDVGTEAAWELESTVSTDLSTEEGTTLLQVGDTFPAELLEPSDGVTLYTIVSSWNPFGQEQLDVFSQMDNESLEHVVVLSLLETESEMDQFLKRGLEEVQVRTDSVGYLSEYIEIGSSPYHIFVGLDGKVLDRKVGVLSEEEIDRLLQITSTR